MMISGKNDIVVTNNYIQTDGKVYQIPKYVQKSFPKTHIIDGNNIYVNGYEFIKRTKKFKRNLLTFLKCLFL